MPAHRLALIFTRRARANCNVTKIGRMLVFVLICWSFPDFSYLFITSGDLRKIPATVLTVMREFLVSASIVPERFDFNGAS
jgi:hypothetical protein